MKRILSVILTALLSFGAASACMKKSNQPSTISLQPVTVIVMDTTQALLDGVEVRVGKTVFKTSYDGRVILKPEALKGVKKLVISREGFQSHTNQTVMKETRW